MPAPKRRNKQTSAYLTGPQVDNLKLISEHTRIPMAALIREGIDMVLKKYPAPKGQEHGQSSSPRSDEGPEVGHQDGAGRGELGQPEDGEVD